MASGGAERVISILSNYLVKDYDIFIITLVDSPSFYTLSPAVTLLHCENKSKPTKGFFEAMQSNFKTYKSILKILKEEKINLCIGFMTSNNILATLAAKRFAIPVIICERNNPYLQSASTGSFWKILRRLVYPMADILTVQTERVKTFYTSFIKQKKLVTIPNPINPDFDRTIKAKKQNVILNVGRLESQKGQDILIRAFAEAQIENWHLHIVGEGSLRAKLENLISELGLKEKVFLLGKRSKISEQYASCKIFAFSSRYEGFPNALLEAMYFGLPCVSTDCPTGPAEIIDNGVNGYLVPIDDTASLAHRLKLLAHDERLRGVIGDAAKIAVEPFQTTLVIEEWQNLIHRLLEKKNNR